jgi:hypothetical protein
VVPGVSPPVESEYELVQGTAGVRGIGGVVPVGFEPFCHSRNEQ